MTNNQFWLVSAFIYLQPQPQNHGTFILLYLNSNTVLVLIPAIIRVGIRALLAEGKR